MKKTEKTEQTEEVRFFKRGNQPAETITQGQTLKVTKVDYEIDPTCYYKNGNVVGVKYSNARQIVKCVNEAGEEIILSTIPDHSVTIFGKVGFPDGVEIDYVDGKWDA